MNLTSQNASQIFVAYLLVSSWLPATGLLQAAAYASPGLALVFGIASRSINVHRAAELYLVALLAIVLVSVVANFESIYPENFFLGLVTHFAWILIVFRLRASAEIGSFAVSVVAAISVFQFTIGVAQLLIRTGGTIIFTNLDSGDAVVGTLLDNSHLFVCKMLLSAMLLGVALVRGRRDFLVKLGFVSSAFGALIGSALFLTALFSVGVILFLLFAGRWLFYGYSRAVVRKFKLASFLFFGVLSFLFFALQAENAALIGRYTNTASEVLSGHRAFGLNKFVAAVEAASLLKSEPFHAIFGFGLGHYSSRAALIASGEYLRDQPNFIPINTSEATREHVVPYWNRSIWSVQYQDGVMNQPFFSVQSIVMELGLFALLCVCAIFAGLFRRSSYLLNTGRGAVFVVNAVGLSFVIPLILFSDNWLEYPHFALQVAAMVLCARSES